MIKGENQPVSEFQYFSLCLGNIPTDHKIVIKKPGDTASVTVFPNTVSSKLCSPKRIDPKKDQRPPGDSFIDR